MQTKKGFILIYTILIGAVCLMVMMYIFDIQMEEMRYTTSTKRHVLKEDNYQKYKEYLMTIFFTYIDENYDQIKKTGVNEFFSNSKNEIIKYEKAKVSYSNKTNEFIFTTPYEEKANRNDYFNLEVTSESFQIKYIKTDYINK